MALSLESPLQQWLMSLSKTTNATSTVLKEDATPMSAPLSSINVIVIRQKFPSIPSMIPNDMLATIHLMDTFFH
jgi:hypothetical protein